MSPQALAAYDPIFLMHHSFIDLVWELFRRIQLRRGVDPTTDYPMDVTDPAGHRYNDPSGFGLLLNRHSLSDIFTREMYTYQLPPTCTRERLSCGTPYLRCDTSTGRARCVAATVFDIPPNEVFDIEAIARAAGQKRRKRNVPGFANNEEHVNSYLRHLNEIADVKCQPENVNDHYVNNFNVNGVTNKNIWSYIPVQVIVDTLPAKINSNAPAIYPKCQRSPDAPFSVYVETNGLNYKGFYKDVTHVKKGLSVTSDIVYVAVPTPSNTSSEVLISAYDSCGRLCRTFCRSGENDTYRPCAGSVRVTSETPLHYGSDVKSLSQQLWIHRENSIPSFDSSCVFMQVLCDNNLSWPW